MTAEVHRQTSAELALRNHNAIALAIRQQSDGLAILRRRKGFFEGFIFGFANLRDSCYHRIGDHTFILRSLEQEFAIWSGNTAIRQSFTVQLNKQFRASRRRHGVCIVSANAIKQFNDLRFVVDRILSRFAEGRIISVANSGCSHGHHFISVGIRDINISRGKYGIITRPGNMGILDLSFALCPLIQQEAAVLTQYYSTSLKGNAIVYRRIVVQQHSLMVATRAAGIDSATRNINLICGSMAAGLTSGITLHNDNTKVIPAICVVALIIDAGQCGVRNSNCTILAPQVERSPTSDVAVIYFQHKVINISTYIDRIVACGHGDIVNRQLNIVKISIDLNRTLGLRTRNDCQVFDSDVNITIVNPDTAGCGCI